MKCLQVIIILVSLSSCAFFQRTSSKDAVSDITQKTTNFNLVDKSGEFKLIRESGYVKTKNQFVTKRQVFSKNDSSKLLEKSIVISTPGNVKSLRILRPHISQYTVWFEKQKFFTEMKISPKDKSMIIKMVSPEKQWNGEKKIRFPKMTGIYCYFSQIIECAKLSGFIKEASKRQAGSMRVLVIWEGYPYFQEQYTNLPDEVFSEASLDYDGKNRNGERRFTLKFSNQSIFYFVDKKSNLSKMFWVTQGLSLTRE